MVHIRDNLYVGNGVKSERTIRKAIIKRKKIKEAFLIAVCKNNSYLLEIIDLKEMLKDIYISKDYNVIGIASSKDEAKELVAKIFSDYVDVGGNFCDFKKSMGDLVNE